MDAHRDPAVDILAPQDADQPLGRIQRRPFDIALNIDRHQPQLHHAGLDRRPPDRDRDDRLRELRREIRLQERRKQKITKTVMPKPSQFPTTRQASIYGVLSFAFGIYFLYIVSFYVYLYYYGSFKHYNKIHSNTTDTNLMTSLNATLIQGNRRVGLTHAFCSLTCASAYAALSVGLLYIDYRTTQPVNSLKDSTEAAIYRYLSLGSYITALLLTLANGCNIYVSYGLRNVITLITGFPSEYINLVHNLHHSSQEHLVVSSLVGLAEWLFGCFLYRMEHALRPQGTIPWMAIISGITSVLVNVCVIMIC